MKWIKVLIDSISGKGFSRQFSGKGMLGGDYVDRQMFQQSGFTSIPAEGSQGITIQNGQNYVCVATEDNPDNVPELQNKGDVAIYSGSEYVVKISANGSIEIIGSKIEIKGDGTPGSVVLGAGVAEDLMKDSIIQKYNSHGHIETGSPGGTTSAPVISPTTVPPSTVTFLQTDATSEVQGS
jgi:hypothetical protein|tara:strand:+ start:4618 stop:5160 length:543 start_codon:yes stop_codon:yes gene_type:complete